MSEPGILVSYAGKVAKITLNVPSKLNALTGDLYYQLAHAMNEVAARDDVVITVLTGRGRYFSAYVATSLCPFPSHPPKSISGDMVYQHSTARH
jgi:1,4-dihydroxy-2-naphthoyl-CoA synthase